MKLLDEIQLNAGHEIVWMNEKAREQWSDAIEKINFEVQKTELLSVIEDQRECGTVTLNPRDLVGMSERHPELVFEPLSTVKRFKGFAHRHEAPQEGEDFYIYYAYSKTIEGIKGFRKAYESNDHIIIGKLLGFPECCARFFEPCWNKRFVDPIFQAAVNTKVEEAFENTPVDKRFDPVPISDRYNKKREITVEAHPYSNAILRYVGIRAGFHIPHSFRCKESIKLWNDRVKVFDPNLKEILDALLSMPMEWSALHGIAEIRTPIFWIVTSSVQTVYKYTVKTLGQFIPKEKDDA